MDPLLQVYHFFQVSQEVPWIHFFLVFQEGLGDLDIQEVLWYQGFLAVLGNLCHYVQEFQAILVHLSDLENLLLHHVLVILHYQVVQEVQVVRDAREYLVALEVLVVQEVQGDQGDSCMLKPKV